MIKKLTVTFSVNMEFSNIKEFMDWLEVGLRVASNENGWEIVERKID